MQTRTLEPWERLSKDSQLRLVLGLMLATAANLDTIPVAPGLQQDWLPLIDEGFVTRLSGSHLKLTELGKRTVMRLAHYYVTA